MPTTDSDRAPLIVIAEDNEELRGAIADTLTEAGYRVAHAADGQVAWNLLQTGDVPKLVIVDLMMPVMTGQELIRAIQSDARLSGVKLIVLSSTPSCTDVPADIPYLKKPVTAGVLLDAVRIAMYLSARAGV